MEKCQTCNGRKRIEVIVMGTDTDWVECPDCKPNKEVIERTKKIKQIKKNIKYKTAPYAKNNNRWYRILYKIKS